MRRWKRSLILLLAVCLSVSFLSGCTSNGGEETGEGAKTRFVFGDTTFNPENEEPDVNPHNTYSG
ncbi:hypothetical protein HMPREF0372_00139 [Flavonifractor plautii ATCC 29863]|uniref:Uncharacterized protein n=1 Tax=Flavonifractor plautii ATCC 29863 TaxID=411475 RepID=G9YKX9_FLAPL|nr:hypothetical protein HMPREF0372_00139 [Flavonifractor plautii ATCC 29863]